MRRAQAGFGLIEVLVAMVVGAIVLVFALTTFTHFFKTEIDMRKRVGDVEDFSLIKLRFGLGVAGGNLRFFFFTGNGPAPEGGACGSCTPTGTDRTFGRLLIPMRNVCRDLTTSCPGAVTLLTAMGNFSHPAPYGLCLIGTNQLLIREWDGQPLRRLIALVNPPSASLWLVNGTPQPYSDLGALTPTCLEGIRAQYNGALPAAGYFTVTINPAVANAFTGGQCVCDADKINAVTEYPARVLPVDIYSLGLQPEEDAFSWGMVNCEVAQGTYLQFNCNRPPEFAMRRVRSVQIDQTYKVQDPSALGMWYTLNAASNPIHCTTHDCKNMAMTSTIQVQLPGETYTNLHFEQFSLLKTDILRKMRFSLQNVDGKIHKAEVQF